jgi:hypothetical protein
MVKAGVRATIKFTPLLDIISDQGNDFAKDSLKISRNFSP